MEPQQYLIISDPPHGEVDFAKAGPVVGLAAVELRMKANYPIPEIWLTDTDESAVDEAAQALRDAGLSVVSITGDDLAGAPEREFVTSFAFGEPGVTAQLDHGELELSYDAPMIPIFCQPHVEIEGDMGASTTGTLTEGLTHLRSGMFKARESQVGLDRRLSIHGLGADDEGSPEDAPFLDVYLTHENLPRRVAFVQDRLDFSGLGELQLQRASDNLVMLVAELEDKLSNAQIDRRLINMTARKRPMVGIGTTYSQERKGFAFATQALSQLLDSISPELKDLSQFQLASQLAYLTRK